MYAVMRTCPIQCLAPFLSRPTYSALEAGIPNESATVGQVVELYEQGRLVDIYNISGGRMGEIRRCLIRAKVIDLSSQPIVNRSHAKEASTNNGHHASCPHRRSTGG